MCAFGNLVLSWADVELIPVISRPFECWLCFSMRIGRLVDTVVSLYLLLCLLVFILGS